MITYPRPEDSYTGPANPKKKGKRKAVDPLDRSKIVSDDARDFKNGFLDDIDFSF